MSYFVWREMIGMVNISMTQTEDLSAQRASATEDSCTIDKFSDDLILPLELLRSSRFIFVLHSPSALSHPLPTGFNITTSINYSINQSVQSRIDPQFEKNKQSTESLIFNALQRALESLIFVPILLNIPAFAQY
jgi:hypothetical protein